MTDTASYDQQSNMLGGGDVMEVVMSGGDGTMSEDTLTQVVNMLQMEGQLTQGNHTIVIRQPGSDEVQMIQAMQNGGELVLTKASAADVQALQNRGALNNINQEYVENASGQVVMVDETGNIVEGNLDNMVQMPASEGQELSQENFQQLQQITSSESMNGTSLNGQDVKTHADATEVINNFVSTGMSSDITSQHGLISTTPETPVTITHSMNTSRTKTSNEAVHIRVDTGVARQRSSKFPKNPNAIVISTTTGQTRYQPPRLHKCEACVINFVSKIAYMNHMETCPSKKKTSTKGIMTYTCVFCETKFATRLSLMQHVPTCDKANNSKNIGNPKLRTNDSRFGVSQKNSRITGDSKKVKKAVEIKPKFGFKDNKNDMYDASDDIDDMLEERDVETDEEDKNLAMDDLDDIKEIVRTNTSEESSGTRKSLKHLGPFMYKGMLKCRDCDRTFSKESLYNRHVNGCTVKPAVNNIEDQTESTAKNAEGPIYGTKRKREDSFAESNAKRASFGPKIVSVDPKKVFASSFKSKSTNLYEEPSDEEVVEKGLFRKGFKELPKHSKMTGGSISKIVKISPGDSLVKRTCKNLISKASRSVKAGSVCGLCGDKSTSLPELGEHIKSCHTEDIVTLRDTLDGKGSISYIKCPLCGIYFGQSHNLLLHLVGAHPSNLQDAQDEVYALELSLPCAFCESTMVSQQSLLEHIALCHIDQLAQSAPSSIQTSSIDVEPLVKNNLTDVVSDQESVKCSDCGLLILVSFFSHHKCVAQNSSSQKSYVCFDAQCAETNFFKLNHLLMHFIQVHEKSAPCQKEQFDTLARFFDWLKQEENQIKKKYTKSLQRLRNGKLTTVWICHHFHNSMANGSSLPKQDKSLNREDLCYSRIHATTDFNATSSRYDGETTIKYYPEHVHPSVQIKPPVSKVEVKAPVKETPFPVPVPVPAQTLEKPVTTDEELKELFETNETEKESVDNKESDITEKCFLTDQPKSSDDDIMNQVKEVLGEYVEPQNQDSKTVESTSNVPKDAISEEDMLIKNLMEENNETTVQEPTLEQSGIVPQIVPPESKVPDDVFDVPPESKVPDDVFDVPPESKVPDDVFDVPQVNMQSESSNLTSNMEMTEYQTAEEDEEENTFVLPADHAEWKKLFELLRDQIEQKVFTNESLTKVHELLPFEDNIATLPLEKQVDVFTSLCALTNVSMT